MRACVLTTVHRYNDNRIFYKHLPTLLRAGYQVTYIAPCPEELRSVEGMDLIPLPLLPRSRRPLNWWRALKAALHSRADIFHFHDPELIGVGLLLKMLTGRPVVYDVHENYPQVMQRRLWIPEKVRPAVAKAMGVWEWLATRALDAIVAANPPTYQRFQRATRKAVLVNNYVDLSRFDHSPASISSKGDSPYFVYCGSLSSQRGALDCLRAFELLSREDARLLLVGPLDDADPSVSDLPDRLPPGARLLKAQPFEQLPSLLRSSVSGLVTLHPTPNYLEILPTKLFEYMAASIPVIAYDLPLIRPIIEEARCGILVKPGDIEGLRSAMSYILDHPAEAGEMGRRGRQAVMERYSWDMEGRKLLGLYEELLLEKPPPGQRRRKE